MHAPKLLFSRTAHGAYGQLIAIPGVLGSERV